MSMDKQVIVAALRYAAALHDGTYRPDRARTPFVSHLSETAELVAQAGGSPAEVAAAWLHDAVEDGLTTVEDLAQRFGREVADLVAAVSDAPEDVGRAIAERKAIQAERLAAAPEGAKRIKLAEQISILKALAVERPLSWSVERAEDYVEGSRLVAAACAAASPLLAERYAAALAAARH
ncbi:bifunctional (p)ppGpp synthetase/guanosine-3',5'-bis(diphosphate) 3'-pyrophosphohydrolase [Azospirillum sp. YIM B02556]|uniref:Bifunctional (P)ppGpp synthetase/guanosine-3',5'-bis(Diphosphate) 3'-pyrophosphohydrolase n=1 Tax=Azospirillum endophyticum TaxID=2800326 RepID=A0ABS1F536_9PROT|nr:HD domain-containing protein [Azospirillum endophyticum]MBK1838536.1 bifunctional (p)ppGpp synthetase/guanosine-3',5'-bis(diphosphate) 3'-pyrophosphohydrolase [Azospirillum endophyticum]